MSRRFILAPPVPPTPATNGYGQPFTATQAEWYVFAAPSDGRILADVALRGGAGLDESAIGRGAVDGLTVTWPANATPPAWTDEAFANFLREVSS